MMQWGRDMGLLLSVKPLWMLSLFFHPIGPRQPMSSLFHNRFRIVVDRAYDVPVSNGGIHVPIIDSRSTKFFSPHARRRRRHGSRVAAVVSWPQPN